jgi:hypothetical protein
LTSSAIFKRGISTGQKHSYVFIGPNHENKLDYLLQYATIVAGGVI